MDLPSKELAHSAPYHTQSRRGVRDLGSQCAPYPSSSQEDARLSPLSTSHFARLSSREGRGRRARDSRLQIKGQTPSGSRLKTHKNHESGGHSSTQSAQLCQGWGLREPAANTKRLQKKIGAREGRSTQRGLSRNLATQLPCPHLVPVPMQDSRGPHPTRICPQDLLKLRAPGFLTQGLSTTVLFLPVAPASHHRPLSSQRGMGSFRPS